MTPDQQADMIALARFVERARKDPVTHTFMLSLAAAELRVAGIAAIGKGELADLRARATGTTLTSEARPKAFELEVIAKTIEWWLDFAAQADAKSGFVRTDETQIFSLPTNPSVGMFKRWIRTLRAAAGTALNSEVK